MKKVIISILCLGSLFAASCASDPCKDQNAVTKCTGNGTLVANGSSCDCSCNAGYTGTNCSSLVLTKVVGTWNLSSSAVLGTNQNVRSGKTVITQSGTTVSRVQITNLNQFFYCSNGGTQADVICYANINGNGELVLDPTAQCGIVFTGTGTIQSNGSIIFKYTAKNATDTYNCESTLAK